MDPSFLLIAFAVVFAAGGACGFFGHSLIQKEGTKVREDAKAEAAKIVADAKAEVAKFLAEAKAKL